MAETGIFYKTKKCSVNLTRLTCQQIAEKLGRRPSTLEPPPPPPPPPPRPSWIFRGRRIHFLQAAGRGKQIKMSNGQCIVTSSSKSMMKLKIATRAVADDDNYYSSQFSSFPVHQRNQKDRETGKYRNKVDVEAGNATAAALVESGYFDGVVFKKRCVKQGNKKIDKSTSITKTPTNNRTLDYYCSPFSSRSMLTRDQEICCSTSSPLSSSSSSWPLSPIPKPFIKEVKKRTKKRKRKICMPISTTTVHLADTTISQETVSSSSSSSPVSTSGYGLTKAGGPSESKRVEYAGSRSSNAVSMATNEEGDNWVSELFSTTLASEVVQEAMDEYYMPDVSFIHSLTEDESNDGITFAEATAAATALPYEETLSVSLCSPDTTTSIPTVSSTNIRMDSDLGWSEEFEIIDLTSPVNTNDEESTISMERSNGKLEEALQKFAFYEELYKNDEILIHAEDEELPEPD